MGTLNSIVQWFFTGSIYGVALVAFAVYALTSLLKKLIPKLPSPAIIAAIAFFVALFTFPSIPRYQFEKEVLSQIEGKEYIRVTNKIYLGDVTEPLTWLHAPLGSVSLVMPNNPPEGGFREVVMKYKEEPRVVIVDPDCEDKTILRSSPEDKGIFRYSQEGIQEMNDEEILTYCNHDWSKEKEALLSAMNEQEQE